MATKGNIRLFSDGTYHGTRLVLVREDGTEEEIKYATAFSWHLDVDAGMARAHMTVVLPHVGVEMPAELVEFVTEPKFTIMDYTPWYTRVWLWLKRGWVD